jgi:hypothetical protein
MLNQRVPGFKLPIRQVALALSLIKGDKVDLWVRNMLNSLRRLHPIQHNVPAVWNFFEREFCDKFTDSTGELHARNQLEGLKFKYPNINGHIAKFKDLIVKANYNLDSQEAINLFLKGFNRSRTLLNRVFTPPVLVTYIAMKRRLIAIVKSMQLVNSIIGDAPNFRAFQHPPLHLPQGNQQVPWNYAPPQVTSSNAPHWMNNMAVLMDTSSRAQVPNWQNRPA